VALRARPGSNPRQGTGYAERGTVAMTCGAIADPSNAQLHRAIESNVATPKAWILRPHQRRHGRVVRNSDEEGLPEIRAHPSGRNSPLSGGLGVSTCHTGGVIRHHRTEASRTGPGGRSAPLAVDGFR